MDRDATAGESGGGAAGSGIASAAIARLPAFGRRHSSVATAVTHHLERVVTDCGVPASPPVGARIIQRRNDVKNSGR
jgi:hypothetical protein